MLNALVRTIAAVTFPILLREYIDSALFHGFLGYASFVMVDGSCVHYLLPRVAYCLVALGVVVGDYSDDEEKAGNSILPVSTMRYLLYIRYMCIIFVGS